MSIFLHYSIISLWVTGYRLPHASSHGFDAADLSVLGSSAACFHDESDTKGAMYLV